MSNDKLQNPDHKYQPFEKRDALTGGGLTNWSLQWHNFLYYKHSSANKHTDLG